MTSRSNQEKRMWVSGVLNIRPEEQRPVVLLILFSFFLGLALAFYFTASNAIFIRHFPSSMIPVSFIASGIAVYLTWLLLSLVDRRLPVTRQLIVKFIFVVLSVLVISAGVWLHNSDGLTFIMYTFVRVLVYITLVTFWGLAGKLFNLRQGKRIFGLIGAGEVISIIIGYFSIPVLLQFVMTPALLFLSSAALLICLVIVIVIIRTYREQLGTSAMTVRKETKQERKEWKYLNLIKKPYFMLTSLMALLPIFGYLFVDFMFLHQTKHEFSNDQETIARFFGYVLGFVAVVELIFKLFVSGRLLNRYGLKPSLLSLPFALLVSTVMAAIFGSFYGPMGIFFAFIVFSRLLERSVRGAIYEPAFQILYQPVPSEQRLAFQSQIEGIPKALGTVITGIILIAFTSIHSLNLVYYNFFFILILILWIRYGMKMFTAYRGRIKDLLAGQKTLTYNLPGKDILPGLSVLRDEMIRTRPEHFNRLFRLARDIDPVKSEGLLNDLLQESPVPVRTEVVRYIEENQVLASRENLINLRDDPVNAPLKPALSSALEELDLAGSYSLDMLMNLSRSDDPRDREVAARLLAHSPRYKSISMLSDLMLDKDARVRKAALVAAGKVKRYELWPGIAENLISEDYGPTASAAIRNIGEPAVGELEKQFRKMTDNTAGQMRLIKLLGHIGGDKAIAFLRKNINYPGEDIRMEVLKALSRLGYQATVSEQVVIRQTIENIIEAMVWIIAAIIDVGEDRQSKYLLLALNDEMSMKRENIFLFLSLMYDPNTISLIRKNIESGNNQSKIFALEISDMVVSPDIKDLLLPLFDDISLQERLSLFRLRFPQEKLNRLERLFDIINKDYNVIGKWTKACALELLVNYDKAQVMEILCANLVNPSQVMRETAAWVLFTMDNEKYFDTVAVQTAETKKMLEGITKKLQPGGHAKNLLISEKWEALKNSTLFSVLPDHILSELSFAATEIRLQADESIVPEQDREGYLGLVLSGQISVTVKRRNVKAWKSGHIFFIMGPNGESHNDIQYISTGDTLLLKIDMTVILDIMAEFPEFTRKMIPLYLT